MVMHAVFDFCVVISNLYLIIVVKVYAVIHTESQIIEFLQ